MGQVRSKHSNMWLQLLRLSMKHHPRMNQLSSRVQLGLAPRQHRNLLKNLNHLRRKRHQIPSLRPPRKRSHHSKGQQRPSQASLKDRRAASSLVAHLQSNPRLQSKRQRRVREKKQRTTRIRVRQSLKKPKEKSEPIICSSLFTMQTNVCSLIW